MARAITSNRLAVGLSSAALLTALSGGAYSVAAGVSRPITVCVTKRGGSLYQSRKCARGDRKLSWNRVGPPGATGATGATGPQGPGGSTINTSVAAGTGPTLIGSLDGVEIAGQCTPDTYGSPTTYYDVGLYVAMPGSGWTIAGHAQPDWAVQVSNGGGGYAYVSPSASRIYFTGVTAGPWFKVGGVIAPPYVPNPATVSVELHIANGSAGYNASFETAVDFAAADCTYVGDIVPST